MGGIVAGMDVGSSSVKVALMDVNTGQVVGQCQAPDTEMEITSPRPGWAEQQPHIWWQYVKQALQKALAASHVDGHDVEAIGIAYQMHGLVLVDRHHQVLRPAIIWCDSRAVSVGASAERNLGSEYCQTHYLNTPGNFTASKLAWVKQNEPEIFDQVYKAMLPGDYIALRLTGEIATTVPGLSEGVFWDFRENQPAFRLLQEFGLDPNLLPERVPTFAHQGNLLQSIADELGLRAGIPVAYRAGDQPNNAFSLNVQQPGEVAATAGTSGVIYAVTDRAVCDPLSRVNTFVHVNDTADAHRNGVLLCINGTGILNSWLKRLLADLAYPEMNALAARVPIGSEGLTIHPFGNGAERILANRNLGAQVSALDLNRHHRAHLARAVQEGIVFALAYGFEVLQAMGIHPTVIRAGHANMFLSPVFREAFVNTLQVPLELYETSGAVGAARGAGVGAGLFSIREAFRVLDKIGSDYPEPEKIPEYGRVYQHWKNQLQSHLSRE